MEFKMKNNCSLLLLLFVQLSSCTYYLAASQELTQEEKALKQKGKDSLLDIAASWNDLASAEIALAQGANPNYIIDTKTGYSVLHKAAKNGYYKIVEALLKAGAYVNMQTSARSPLNDSPDRLTPLHMAAQNNHFWTVKILVEYGAAINARAKINLKDMNFKHKDTAITLTSSWLIKCYLFWAARNHLQNLINNGAEAYSKNKCLQMPETYRNELRTVNQERWRNPHAQITIDNIPEKILAFYDDTKELQKNKQALFEDKFWNCVMNGEADEKNKDGLHMAPTDETRICIAHYILEGTIKPENYQSNRLPMNASPLGKFVTNYQLRKSKTAPSGYSTLAKSALLTLAACGACYFAYKLYPKGLQYQYKPLQQGTNYPKVQHSTYPNGLGNNARNASASQARSFS